MPYHFWRPAFTLHADSSYFTTLFSSLMRTLNDPPFNKTLRRPLRHWRPIDSTPGTPPRPPPLFNKPPTQVHDTHREPRYYAHSQRYFPSPPPHTNILNLISTLSNRQVDQHSTTNTINKHKECITHTLLSFQLIPAHYV